MGMPADLEEEQARAIERASVFCFDHKKFDADMRSGDLLVVVLKAHLYLEHVLIQTLNDAFLNPEAARVRRMNFPSRLELCIALGLVPELWEKPVKQINEMRNKVAHRLEFEFSDSEKLALFRAMPDFLQKETLEVAQLAVGEEQKLEWWNLFLVIVTWLEIARQKTQENRVLSEFSSRHLRRVLDKQKK